MRGAKLRDVPVLQLERIVLKANSTLPEAGPSARARVSLRETAATNSFGL